MQSPPILLDNGWVLTVAMKQQHQKSSVYPTIDLNVMESDGYYYAKVLVGVDIIR